MNLARALDSLIAFWSPRWALERLSMRDAYERFAASYDLGKQDRTTAPWKPTAQTGDPADVAVVQRSRYRAWDLYRNNPHARKLVRAITGQLLGTGMELQPLAKDRRGEPDEELRRSIGLVWKGWGHRVRFAARPGDGASSWGLLQRLLLREIILSGEVLVRLRVLPRGEAQGYVRLALEVIEADRLAESSLQLTGAREGNEIFRGIELDGDGARVAYHVYRRHPQFPTGALHLRNNLETVRIPAEQVLHLYVQEQASQYRGVSWLAPVGGQLRDTGDYQFNELTSSRIAACFAVGIKTRVGRPSNIGLNAPSGQDNSDQDGNSITRVQPGMIFRISDAEDIVPVNPQRPAQQVESFANHLLRGVAAGAPGVKASTVTGDYRESSFSSERSADNDAWRETEDGQDWFRSCFCQPVYGLWLQLARMDGLLDFEANDLELVSLAKWSAPVPRSINPEDDAAAAATRIHNGTSSVQDEAAALNRDWRQIVEQHAQFIAECRRRGLPDSYALSILGLQGVVRPADVQDAVQSAYTISGALADAY